MNESRVFPLGVILSITTGILLTEDFGEVYDILNWMTDDDLSTIALPRASRECSPYLLDQHPKLAKIDTSGVRKENWRAWLEDQIKVYGAELPVRPIPKDDHDIIDPQEEAERLVGKDRVITVQIDSED